MQIADDMETYGLYMMAVQETHAKENDVESSRPLTEEHTTPYTTQLQRKSQELVWQSLSTGGLR